MTYVDGQGEIRPATPFEAPDASTLRAPDLSGWNVQDRSAPRLGTLRAVGLYRDYREPGTHAGDVEHDLVTQGAMREVEVMTKIREQHTHSVTRTATRAISAQFNLPDVSKLLGSLGGVIFPDVPQLTKLKSTLELGFKSEVSDVRATEHVVAAERAVTEKLTVPADQDRHLYVCPEYYLVRREFYVTYLDYIVIDYSSGKRQVRPSPAVAPRAFRRVQARSDRRYNRVALNMHVLSVWYYVPTGSTMVLFDPPATPVDPDVLPYQFVATPVSVQRTTEPVDLYEIAVARSLRSRAHVMDVLAATRAAS